MSRFHIGNIVFPMEIDGGQCNATKEEMSRLYGVVVGLSDNDGGYREYSVEWLDNDTDEPAEFGHGLKNSWFEKSELTGDLSEYIDTLNSLSFDEEDEDDGEDDLDEIVAELRDIIDDKLVYLCGMYGLDPYEYADTIKERLCNNLQ